MIDEEILLIAMSSIKNPYKGKDDAAAHAYDCAMADAHRVVREKCLEVGRDAARYRVFRERPSFALTMGQFSTPGIIDALCDAAIDGD